MTNKNAKIEFKLEQELFQKYKDLCEKKGQTMSKKLRSFIEKEIKIEEEIKLIENDILEYMQGVMWQFNTPEVRKTIKEDVDNILSKYKDRGIIYDYFNKCDEENNTAPLIDNQVGVLDTFIQKIKDGPYLVNNITVLRSGEIEK
jgi:predicted DNA-binding protein